MSFKLTSAKHVSGKTEIKWNQNGSKMSLEDNDAPRQNLIKGIKSLEKYMSIFLNIDEERITATGVHIKESGDTFGVVMTGKLEAAEERMIAINTPNISIGEESESSLIDQHGDKIMSIVDDIEKEAISYVKGKRAQMTIEDEIEANAAADEKD